MNETDLIKALNYEEAKQYLGGVVFVSIIMAFGFVGNLHVLLVYTFHIEPSNHRIFILELGVLDFITCIIGMPFIIFDLRNPLTFTVAWACKVLRFTNYFICISSSLTLLVIAIDRYRKICVPLGRQITERMAKLSCLLVFAFSLLMSWPAPVLFGIATVSTTNPNINGSRCDTEEKPNFTKYQAYFNIMLISGILVSFIILVLLYTLIWRVITKRNDKISYSNKDSTGNNFHENKSSQLEKSKYDNEDSDSGTKECGFESGNDVRKFDSQKTSKRQKQNSSDRSRRTTLIFLMITVVFFLSFVPHMSLKIVAFLKKDFMAELQFTEKVLYNTFVWCVFINNMANCFVYGFFDVRFRSEVRKMYGKLFCHAR